MITNISSGEQQQNSSSKPAALSMRIQSLDVLRGIAVLGALIVSILMEVSTKKILQSKR